MSRGLLVLTLVGLSLAVGLSACGDDDSVEREQVVERRVAVAKREAREDARRDERLRQLERELRQQKEAAQPGGGKQSATPESARPSESSPGTSQFAGRWRGTGTQYTPRGTQQDVSFLTTINSDGSGGTHSEYITGRRADSDCRGTLRRVSTGRYIYTEVGDSSCISTTTIEFSTVNDSPMRLFETYRTATAGSGRVEGTLHRVGG